MNITTMTFYMFSMGGGTSLSIEDAVLHEDLKPIDSPWFEWTHISHQVPWATAYPDFRSTIVPYHVSADFSLLGFKFMIREQDDVPNGDSTPHFFGVILPDWFLVAIFAIAPAIWVRRFRHRREQCRRDREGCCLNCGYSLQGLPDPPRCPECGVTPSQKAVNPGSPELPK